MANAHMGGSRLHYTQAVKSESAVTTVSVSSDCPPKKYADQCDQQTIMKRHTSPDELPIGGEAVTPVKASAMSPSHIII